MRCRLEHRQEGEVAERRGAYQSATDAVEVAQEGLMRAVRERYIEENLWCVCS